jgi:ribosomal protein S27E
MSKRKEVIDRVILNFLGRGFTPEEVRRVSQRSGTSLDMTFRTFGRVVEGYKRASITARRLAIAILEELAASGTPLRARGRLFREPRRVFWRVECPYCGDIHTHPFIDGEKVFTARCIIPHGGRYQIEEA